MASGGGYRKPLPGLLPYGALIRAEVAQAQQGDWIEVGTIHLICGYQAIFWVRRDHAADRQSQLSPAGDGAHRQAERSDAYRNWLSGIGASQIDDPGHV